ncbi:MAG: (Fe-S)-binding protein [Nitrososphaerota archaeon]|nr:(Fe-S)-binding protein [Nitrososphaerota archaeon]MDG6946248.1 (Fe-S)-binding protein [Nitrososphaerota archaeon]
MAGLDIGYLAAYAISLASVVVVAFVTLSLARKWSISLGPGRVAGLGRDEARRLRTGDAVFLMHLSIALGVGVTIVDAVIAPAMAGVPLLLDLFRAASVPLIVGLVVAFGWRVQRYYQSRRVGRGLGVPGGFASASTALQLVLMAAIALTTSELVLLWVPTLGWADLILDAVRNALVAAYYARPSVNLIAKFDRPLNSVSTPFNLADVIAGKTDPGAIRAGVGKVSEFSPDQSLSFDSCVEIGACEASCPATAAGRPLSPRVLVRKLSLLSRADGGGSDVLTSVGEDELWSCTSCGACVASCPVSVKHLDLIYDLRRELVSKGRLDREKSAMLANLAQSQNPYGFKNAARASWAEGMDVDTLQSNPKTEYLYWVGCVSSFDQRAQRVARALSKILKHAGVSFAILGAEEMCVGDPARRLGEEGRYQELVLQNIEKLNSYGVKKILATCPHCFNALKNEYPQFGGKFEVVYHTQLISDLIREGKVSVPPDKVQRISVTLHDACYASRYNNIFEPPREMLEASVDDVREMGRRKEKTFCCGAGGSNYWFKVPQQKSIAGIRAEEAAGTGAKTIATECPFCLSMLDDATKVSGSGMDVRDVAEIVAECI